MTVNEHVVEAWRVVAPPKDNPHGPLPPLLLLMTVVTGLVDAFSYLSLGHVLVANMTGNVVFLGFAVGGAPGFVWWASLLAIGTFLVGAFLGGRLNEVVGHHRGRHLCLSAIVETVLVLLSLVVTVFTDPRSDGVYHGGVLLLLIALLGIALGLQNATARALAVPDLTTTVLTLTITGIAADSHAAGGQSSKLGRRLVPIATMFLGGLVGAALVLHDHRTWVLVIAAGLLALVVLLSQPASRSQAAWTTKK
ncbi:YoaK family protein [Nocardioides sp. DS6]|uniref:YoaK family protein n=1 Tax=Nocardioides eburneus TaxID=3231482 RepID=A0ABV3T014_9ACTN